MLIKLNDDDTLDDFLNRPALTNEEKWTKECVLDMLDTLKEKIEKDK